MKHIVVIFAHPDDEAFGPSGTLIKEREELGAAIHLICLTDGEIGSNPDAHADLGAVRRKEWQKAAELIGATSMHQLGYSDGHLSNHLYHEIADKLLKIIQDILSTAEVDDTVELLSGDVNGISGHLDHIFASRVACYVFYTLKTTNPKVTRLRLICLPDSWMPEPNTDWLFMEAGRKTTEIHEVVDARDYADQVFAVMHAHYTQRTDCETHIKNRGKDVALNHYIVLE